MRMGYKRPFTAARVLQPADRSRPYERGTGDMRMHATLTPGKTTIGEMDPREAWK